MYGKLDRNMTCAKPYSNMFVSGDSLCQGCGCACDEHVTADSVVLM